MPGKITRLVVIVIAGLLAATGFGLVAYGSSHEDPELTFTENLFELVTSQSHLTIGADPLDNNTFPWTHNNIYWKHKIVDVGENCGEDTFKGHAPNDPRIRHTSRHKIPADAVAAYRNKWICFEARSGDRARYILHDIDTGNPAIFIRRMAAFKSSYLEAFADDKVTYRVGRVKASMTRTSVFAEPAYPWLQAGTACEQIFKGSYMASYYKGDEYVTEPLQFEEITEGSRVPIITVSEDEDSESTGQFVDFIYCFEATDDYGNQTYVQARPNRGPIIYTKSQRVFSDHGTDGATTAHFRLLNVSGYVDWTLAPLPDGGQGDPADCSAADYYDIGKFKKQWSETYRAGDFNDNPVWAQDYLWEEGVAPPIYMPGYRVQEDYFAGRDYCVRAIDEFGWHYYKRVEKTGTPKSSELLPPVISISVQEKFTNSVAAEIRTDSEVTYFEHLILTPALAQRHDCDPLVFQDPYVEIRTFAGQNYFYNFGDFYDTVCVRALGLDGQWGYASHKYLP